MELYGCVKSEVRLRGKFLGYLSVNTLKHAVQSRDNINVKICDNRLDY